MKNLIKALSYASLAAVTGTAIIAVSSERVTNAAAPPVSQWSPAVFYPHDCSSPAMFVDTRGVTAGETFRFDVKPLTTIQDVRLAWKHLPTGETLHQTIAVGYYPTAVCHGHSPGEIYVAGKYLGGATIIERWKLKAPNVLTVTPVGGGLPVTELQANGVGMVQAIYLDAAEERDIITAMRREIDSPTHLLLKFVSQGNVFRMDVTQRPAVYEHVASGLPGTGASVVDPALLGFHSVIQPMRMVDATADGRFAYYFTNGAGAGTDCVLDTDTQTNEVNLIVPIADANVWVDSGYGVGANRLPVYQ